MKKINNLLGKGSKQFLILWFTYIIIFLQIITVQKTAAETVFQFLKSVPVNFVLPILLYHTSISTIFRILFDVQSVNQEKTIIASQLLNLLQDKKNCTALILQQYLEKGCCAQKIKSEVKVESSMDDPSKIQEILGQSLIDDSHMMQAGTLVDWLSTLSAVDLEIGSAGKYKLQVIIQIRDVNKYSHKL